MSKPKQEKASGNERFLKSVGQAEINASKSFEAAHQAVLREAQASHLNRFRGRQAGDVWQGAARDLGSDRLSRGDTTRQGRFEGLVGDALGGSLREGTQRATALSDSLINEGASSRLSNAKASGASAVSEARRVNAVASNKIQLANEWNNDLAGAAVTLGSYGAGQYMGARAAQQAADARTAVSVDATGRRLDGLASRILEPQPLRIAPYG